VFVLRFGAETLPQAQEELMAALGDVPPAAEWLPPWDFARSHLVNRGRSKWYGGKYAEFVAAARARGGVSGTRGD
jgi:hypothetical protein